MELVNQASEWVETYLHGNRAPTPTALEDVRSEYAAEEETTVVANPEIELELLQYKNLKQQIKSMTEEMKGKQAAIQGYMKESQVLRSPDNVVLATLKAPKPSKTINYKGVLNDLTDVLEMPEDAIDRALKANMAIKTGTRRLLVK